MKKLLFLIAATLMLFAGCDAQTPIEAEETPTPAVTAAPAPTPTPMPTPQPTPDMGMFGSQFPEKFLQPGAEPQIGEGTYVSDSINITVYDSRMESKQVTYYVADIYIKDISFFKTGLALGEYDKVEDVPDISQRYNAILAVNGDYYSLQGRSGPIIRNRTLYYEEVSNRRDSCAINGSGEMIFFKKGKYKIEDVKAADVIHMWGFGPILVENYGIDEFFDVSTDMNKRNPRTAIGFLQPGHYIFLQADGRAGSYSRGLDMNELAELMRELGCKDAYNLDGGQTSMMIFNGEIVNEPFRDGRECSDIVYIGQD